MQNPDPETLRAGCDWLRACSSKEGLSGEVGDVICEGETPDDDPDAAIRTVERWASAGGTWWLESRWGGDAPRIVDMGHRIAAGPPVPH